MRAVFVALAGLLAACAQDKPINQFDVEIYRASKEQVTVSVPLGYSDRLSRSQAQTIASAHCRNVQNRPGSLSGSRKTENGYLYHFSCRYQDRMARPSSP